MLPTAVVAEMERYLTVRVVAVPKHLPRELALRAEDGVHPVHHVRIQLDVRFTIHFTKDGVGYLILAARLNFEIL